VTTYDVIVKPQASAGARMSARFAVYGVTIVDGRRTERLLEGGFFTRAAAEKSAREYLGEVAERAERAAGWDPNP
jgi:hypothetical protein